jgi:hypothetical protein
VTATRPPGDVILTRRGARGGTAKPGAANTERETMGNAPLLSDAREALRLDQHVLKQRRRYLLLARNLLGPTPRNPATRRKEPTDAMRAIDVEIREAEATLRVGAAQLGGGSRELVALKKREAELIEVIRQTRGTFK